MKAGGALPMDFVGLADEFVTKTGMTAVQITYSMTPHWKKGEQVMEHLGSSFSTLWKDLGIDLYVHGPMNINPCDYAKRGWSMHNLLPCMEFAETIGAKGVVVHPGSRKDMTEGTAYTNICSFLERVLARTSGVILLETDAGSKGNTKVGSLEFLLGVCDSMNSFRVKLCIDTEHLYARGIDMWDDQVRKDVLERTKNHLRLVHLNAPDPQVMLGSYLDRHSVPFKSFHRNCRPMIKDLVSRYPVILERNSADVQALDMEEIKLTMLDTPCMKE